MAKSIGKGITIVVFLAIVLVLFSNIDYGKKVENTESSDLVVYGDNIGFTDGKNKPFIENGGIYIATDTIGKTIDDNIFYDKIATKVIITTYSDVIKLKVNEKKMSRNMEYVDIPNEAKLKDGQPYVDINSLKDIYHIKVEYNEATNTISIDKKDTSDIPIQYNRVKVYSDISTDSNVIQTLYRDDTVTVYKDSLEHKRWYKVKTDTGKIGYIAKNNVDLASVENSNNGAPEEEQNNNSNNQEKMTMFWQYGSDLNVLEKSPIEGVSIVSPTWYELKNANGEISSKFSQEYYNQAKSNGYKIWPIITNGIDSANYSSDDTSTMLHSEYSREQFIKNLVEIGKANKIDGINIDFEAMKDTDEDRMLFTQFIREMAPILRKNNITLSVDMYFVRYIDRKGVGAASDYVVLMGYDYKGAWSNEAGSIAPISWVDNNVKSLIEDSEIPSHKIILGIPFYTRLWTEKEGEEKPTTKVYTMKNCQEFLDKYKVTPVWDADAGQNYAEYKEGALTYRLWIEDKDSVKERVGIVNKYNLAGMTGWRKGFETSDIWDVIHQNMK